MFGRKNKPKHWFGLSDRGVIALVVLGIVGLAVGSVLYTKPGLLISKEDAVQAVTKHGYTDVRVHSKSIYGIGNALLGNCTDGDHAEFAITAVNTQQQSIEITACANFWRGFTIKIK